MPGLSTLDPSIPSSFHKYFAAWTRIEPRCRSDDFAQGLKARTADPLWFLARQWQFGEFNAEDAGSPIRVEVSHRTKPLTQLILPDAGGTETRIDLDAPLETLVERERVGTLREEDSTTGKTEFTWDWRLRVRVGQHFERLCRLKLGDDAATVIAVYRANLGIERSSDADRSATDDATRRFRQLMEGRAVDGWRLRRARKDDDLPETSADLATVFEALDTWWKRLFSQPPEDAVAWRSDRLDYEFGAAATLDEDAEIVLAAPSYRNGNFDWHSCVVKADPSPPWDAEEDAAETQEYPPTRVTFPGQPHPRWWAFEDSRTDFGDLDVATPDVANLALMEFALVYGGDWFIVPLGVPLGSLTRIMRLQVTDVFGQVAIVEAARTASESPPSRWELYRLSPADAGEAAGPDFLFVPPAVGFREESEPIEEVRFLRDEGANMVWGVERRVPNGLGNPTGGFEAYTERRGRDREDAQANGAPEPAPTPTATQLAYRLATPVPANGLPFVPADALTLLGENFRPGIPSVRLLRAQMLRDDTMEAPAPVPAMGQLLDPRRSNAMIWLDEEAVPREGVKVQLTKQRVRWTDGETYVWLGKKVLVGRGEERSGLRFDAASEQGVSP